MPSYNIAPHIAERITKMLEEAGYKEVTLVQGPPDSEEVILGLKDKIFGDGYSIVINKTP